MNTNKATLHPATFSVLIPFAPGLYYPGARATSWHPTTPGDTLVRGSWTTVEEAHAWALENIPGHPYTIREYEAFMA